MARPTAAARGAAVVLVAVAVLRPGAAGCECPARRPTPSPRLHHPPPLPGTGHTQTSVLLNQGRGSRESARSATRGGPCYCALAPTPAD